ncbi:lytic transglycosylase domain-containing protein [Glaciecola siphonariae]|uniref:Lytic transglycosylase domain-containing protein n=1 Tax=Glaciecola siphonariae TaxID=521012 RepID=A0ABV9LUY3_9ALTE
MHYYFILFFGWLILVASSTVTAAHASQASDATSFEQYAQTLKNQARQKGFDEQFLEQVFATVKQRGAVVKADRNQPERKLTLDTYLQTRVPDWKVEQAVQQYLQHKNTLERIAKQYGVQARFIVALWGNESNFGRIQGNHPVMSSLVSLAYEGRRRELFESQFFAALEILKQGHIALADFNGSWAGAMGQSQFMPSSFLSYAVDANADGRKDIWGTPEDVFASIANFLSAEGWNDATTWGRQVKLTEDFPVAQLPSLEGLTKVRKKSLREWSKMGVTKFDGSPLPALSLPASLILPDDIGGRVYLVYGNFETLMRWNRSYYFGISVAYLSERIAKELGERS